MSGGALYSVVSASWHLTPDYGGQRRWSSHTLRHPFEQSWDSQGDDGHAPGAGGRQRLLNMLGVGRNTHKGRLPTP